MYQRSCGKLQQEGVPEWPQDFTENLEIAEVLAPADISHDSDLERPMKVASRKHRLYFYSLPKKTRIARSASEPRKITRVPCRRRAGNSVTRAEKFGDLTTADHNVLNDRSASRHNHRYSIVVQDLTSQWIQSYPCKTKPSKETEKSLQKSFSSRLKSRTSFILTIHWNLANPAKTYHGIIVRQHSIDSRRMAQLKERDED